MEEWRGGGEGLVGNILCFCIPLVVCTRLSRLIAPYCQDSDLAWPDSGRGGGGLIIRPRGGGGWVIIRTRGEGPH